MGKASGTARDTSTMLDALFPRTRQRVLGLLFGQPQRPFTMSELIRLASAGSGAVQREVERLTDSGLAVIDGEPRRIRAAPSSALFNELTAIFEKTGGVVGELGRVLSPLAHQIYFAILYGSMAKQSERATSDVDLLLVTDGLTLEAVFAATVQQEIDGLLRSGAVRIADAERESNSVESRFDLAYNAAHAFSLAALRHRGYRSDN
jgi:predicted nucleotidyltransferase